MAFGSPLTPDLPQANTGAGMKTPFGITLLPPGSRVAAYVRSTGLQTGDDNFIAGNLVPTLAAGLARVRAGLGDSVVVLPGHSESVTDGTTFSGSLVAGTRIVGFGRGSAMPTFRWTATASQWAVSVADVTISGLRLRLEGANGVVKAINVTGADFGLYNCDIEVASGASNKATIALELGTAADRFDVSNNVFRGTATHNVTDGILIAGVSSNGRISDNEMVFSATAANGNIRVSAAALGLKILRNIMYNTHTASTACFAVGAVAADGLLADNYAGTVNNGTNANQNFILGATCLIRCFQNFGTDEPRTTGVVIPGTPT